MTVSPYHAKPISSDKVVLTGKPKEEKPKEKPDVKPEVISIDKITKSKEKIVEKLKEKRGRPKEVKLDVSSKKEIQENTLLENQWSTKQKLGFWAGVTLTVLGLGILMYKIKIAMDKARLEDEESEDENTDENESTENVSEKSDEFINDMD